MMFCGNIVPSLGLLLLRRVVGASPSYPPLIPPSLPGKGVRGLGRRRRLPRFYVIVTLALVLLSSALYAAPATVSLHEQVLVPQGTVTLAQLADIAGGDELAGQLAAVEIGRSPLPGHQRSISAGYVRMRMARAGFGTKAVTLAGANAVLVRRAGPVRSIQRRPPILPGVGLRFDKLTALSNVEGEARPTGRMGESAEDGRGVAMPAPQPLLRRGEKVQIVVINGGIVISTSGQLLQDAAIGESVMARVRTTGQKVWGTLTGPRQITIRL